MARWPFKGIGRAELNQQVGLDPVAARGLGQQRQLDLAVGQVQWRTLGAGVDIGRAGVKGGDGCAGCFAFVVFQQGVQIDLLRPVARVRVFGGNIQAVGAVAGRQVGLRLRAGHRPVGCS